MLKNYLVTILRQIQKNKIFSFINILGLALGMAACLTIAQYVHFHSSFDQYHSKADEIYRLEMDVVKNGEELGRGISSPSPLLDALAEQSPEVGKIARFYPYNYANNSVIYKNENGIRTLEQEQVYFTEKSAFDLFDFEFLAGSAGDFNQPQKAIMTLENAKRYFDDPVKAIGETFTLSGNNGDSEFELVGILQNIPENSHIQFNLLLSFQSMDKYTEARTNWGYSSVLAYVLIPDEATLPNVLSRVNKIYDINVKEGFNALGYEASFLLQPLKEIHLNTTDGTDFTAGIDKKILVALSIIALIILVIAWINYMNLSLAKTAERMKEMGVRMCMGSSKRQITSMFVLEAFVMNAIAFGVAIGLTQLSAVYIQSLTSLPVQVLDDPKVLLFLTGLMVAGTLFIGMYPYLLLRTIKAVNVLVGHKGKMGGTKFRKGLVFAQFVITSFLIAGTLTVYQQIQYMKHADLKINIENVMVLQSPPGAIQSSDRDDIDKFKKLISSLEQYPEITDITSGGEVPGEPIAWATNIRLKNAPVETGVDTRLISMSTDYPDFFGIEVVAGRGLKKGDDPWTKGDVVINEKLAEKLGFENPEDAIGKDLAGFYAPLSVRGVLENHHHTSLHTDYEPIAFIISGWTEFYFIKIAIPEHVDDRNERFSQMVSNVEREWKEVFVDYPLDYFFLDSHFNQQYQEDERFGTLFTGFSMLAIIIACLGLFGLTSFTIQQRTKEVGIRKVLGASAKNLITLLSKEYLILVTTACVISLPAAWYVMNQWLQDYTFRVEIGWWFYCLPVIMVIGLALLSIIAKIITTIKRNPVESLRYE